MLFFTPKVYIIIDFHCPLSSHSPEAAVSMGLFVDLLSDYLNAYGKNLFFNYLGIAPSNFKSK
jgi:insulysin